MKVYAGVAYCVLLKQTVLAAFIYYGDKKKPEIIISTDITMDVMTMCKYYGLRIHVEFLIKDAKQYPGLQDCMARDRQKFYYCHNSSVGCQSSLSFIGAPSQKRKFFND